MRPFQKKFSFLVITFLLTFLLLGGCNPQATETKSSTPPPPPSGSSPSPTDASLPTQLGSLVQLVSKTEFVAAGSNAYVPPSSAEQEKFRTSLKELLADRVPQAMAGLTDIGLDLVQFTDTGKSSFYLIREKADKNRGWGITAINLKGSKLVIEAPHTLFDTKTEVEAAAFFLSLSAKALLIAGTHRCANTESSPCSGTTGVCGSDEPHRITDAAHSMVQLFHAAHEVFLDSDSSLVAISLHGFASGDGDPHAFISNGTNKEFSADDIANRLTAALKAQTGMTIAAVSCNDGNKDARLCGTLNVQGRYANGSPDACHTSVPSTTGRFLHIEQSLDLRRTEGSPNQENLIKALKMVFGIKD